jgi:hypothetical protein
MDLKSNYEPTLEKSNLMLNYIALEEILSLFASSIAIFNANCNISIAEPSIKNP